MALTNTAKTLKQQKEMLCLGLYTAEQTCNKKSDTFEVSLFLRFALKNYLPFLASVSACFSALDIPTDTMVSSGTLITW